MINQVEIHRKTMSDNYDDRIEAMRQLYYNFTVLPNKDQAWKDFVRLTEDHIIDVGLIAVELMGFVFPHVPDKVQAWNALHRLTEDSITEVRVTANHSLGRVSIFKATEAKSEENFRKEIENALDFFEKSSREANIYIDPSYFCLPFYRSFYAIIFENQKVDVQKDIIMAKFEAEGSENKENLIEIIENLEKP